MIDASHRNGQPLKPELRVRIKLFSTSNSGKTCAILGALYHSVFSIAGENWSVRFAARQGEEFMIQPGSTIDTDVQFLVPDDALSKFPVGSRFTVWEGRDVGQGLVLAVL